MKFSTQEEYGLRLLLQIANRYPESSITIPELAKLEELSEPHVAKLLMILRKAGFIKSIRGQAGGYMLARNPEEIVLTPVLASLGGRLYENGFCERHGGLEPICVHHGNCGLNALWTDVQNAVDGVLNGKTLKSVLDCHPIAYSPKDHHEFEESTRLRVSNNS